MNLFIKCQIFCLQPEFGLNYFIIRYFSINCITLLFVLTQKVAKKSSQERILPVPAIQLY